jgi:hypothetical protein
MGRYRVSIQGIISYEGWRGVWLLTVEVELTVFIVLFRCVWG